MRLRILERMPYTRKAFCVIAFAGWCATGAAFAEVVSVPFGERGTVTDAEPTLTFLWSAQSPKATLIFIPGGEGRIGLSPERKSLAGFYGATLKPLSDASLTSGTTHVVVFDSPVNLPVGNDYPHSRRNREHLLRIESVVRYYRELFAKPVWIMGHSNGAVSITEFYRMLHEAGNASLVEGAIYSSARNGARFDDNTAIPVLFLAHERDGCAKSTPGASRAVYEQLRRNGLARVEYVLLRGGEPQQQHPCHSGFHMFHGASEEAYGAIDRFINANREP